MAKILGEDGRTYLPLSLDTFTEIETQRQLRARSQQIFPGFTFVLSDPLIVADFDARKPDFILIENQYRSWWIGEVEKSTHSLAGHVIPQVEAFRDGAYDESHVESITRLAPALDRERLRMLVESERPGVLVVVDRMIPEWSAPLEAKGARLALFEVFRSEGHRYLFRVNGFCPVPPALFETECRIPASMPQVLQVMSPAGLKLEHQQVVCIMHRGIGSDWVVILADGNCWLRPVRTHSLESERRYRLVVQQDGSYELRELRKR